MDKEILKLLPSKAFKLLSIKETLKVGAAVTKSIFDKQLYEKSFQTRTDSWEFDDIKLVKDLPLPIVTPTSKEDGEKILQIYFSQIFEKKLPVHIDLRKNVFSSQGSLCWAPSKINYSFSETFMEGVCALYIGFYFDDNESFENGLIKLGMIKDSMGEKQKNDIKEIFYKHFGEGKTAAVKFSLKNLQDSFNVIFSYFLKEDIPLNPEFAILGVYLVTLYLTLQEFPHALDVRDAFTKVVYKYKNNISIK